MEKLMIGSVVKSHGIRGEVVVDPTTDQPELRFAPQATLTGSLGGAEQRLTIQTVRPHQKRLLVKFEEIPDRTAADALRGMKFFAAPLHSDADDGFYDHELIGLQVLHQGQSIGQVTGVQHIHHRTLLEMGDILIPFVQDIVPTVDLDHGTLTITPPEGLLDLS